MKAELLNPFLNVMMKLSKDLLQTPLSLQKPKRETGLQTHGSIGCILRCSGDVEAAFALDFSEKLYTHLNTTLDTQEMQTELGQTVPKGLYTYLQKISLVYSQVLQATKSSCNLSAPYITKGGTKSYFAENTEFIKIALTNNEYGAITLTILDLDGTYFVKDSLCLLGIPEAFEQHAVMSLVPFGFSFHIVSDEEHLKKYVQEHPVSFSWINDEHTKDIYPCMEYLESVCSVPYYKNLVYSARRFDKLVAGAAEKLKYLGAVHKKLKMQEAVTRLKDLLSKTGLKPNDRRKGIRFTFKPTDEATIGFKLPDTQMQVTGSLLNISKQGCKATLSSNTYRSYFSPETEFKKTVLRLPGVETELLVDTQITYISGKQVGVEFTKFIGQTQGVLTDYVASLTM